VDVRDGNGIRLGDVIAAAGHDPARLPSIGMLFVRCGNGGISHNSLETVTAADAGIAAQILRDTLLRMAG
jgi:N-carbamoyl-L-amino-acid hydrolase